MLLFLATGRTARSGLVAQIVNNKLRNLIEQCIAFNPKARIQSVKEIRDYVLHDSRRRALKRKREFVAAATLLAVVVGLSVLTYGVGFVAERDRAEKLSFERGYANGYTDGYDAAPVFYRKISETTEKTGSDFGNMAAPGGAFAAQSEGLVFYIADGGIWRMSANGTAKELFVQASNITSLSCSNEWLYYTSGNRIKQTNIYTRVSDVLCNNLPGTLYVGENRFYILTKNGLYRLNTKTGETTALPKLSDCESLNIDGGSLYFISGQDRALYCCDASGNNRTTLADGRFRSACLFGSDLICSAYSNDAESLVKVDSATGETETLLEVHAAMINVTENGIYFLDQSDGSINRCSFDGRIREKISKNRASEFNLAGDWIFYHNKENDGKLWCVRLDGSNDHLVP